jgi:hypothetical protein
VLAAEGCGAEVAVLLDQPRGVGAGDDGADGVTDVLDGFQDAAVDDLLLVSAEEAFDDAVRGWLADESVGSGPISLLDRRLAA